MTSGGSKCWKRDLRREQKFGKEGCGGVSMSRVAMVKHGGSCVCLGLVCSLVQV